MLKKWITESDLCTRWKITKYDLRDIVIQGKLQPFHENLLPLLIYDGGSAIELPDGSYATSPVPVTADDVANCIFLISHVEAYEKKNEITPHKMPTDPPQEIPVPTESKDARTEPITKNKPRSRSSELRSKCIERVEEYLKQQKAKNEKPDRKVILDILMKTVIKEKFHKRAVWNWIKGYFAPLPPYRPKKKEE